MILEVKYPNFFQLKQYHKCRFCGLDIQTLHSLDGKLRTNSLYRMVTIPLRDGSNFRFNCCKNCSKQVKVGHFMHIAKNDPAMKTYLNRSATRPRIVGPKAKVLKIEKV